MATDTTMIALIQELMEEYDSSIDTSSGSSFYTTVITPLLKRIGGDPLNTDVEKLVVLTSRDIDASTPAKVWCL